MLKYSEEKKASAMLLMSAPGNLSAPEVSRRTGIPEGTLYKWRHDAKATGQGKPSSGRNAEGWQSATKFAVVVEAAALSEAELAEYCRKKGLYVDQVRNWRQACEKANDAQIERITPAQRADEKKRVRELEQELRRKEKALAETAALLVLSRKLEALWTNGEDA